MKNSHRLIAYILISSLMFSISACSNSNKYPIRGKFLFESSRSGNSIDLYMSKNGKVALIAKKAYYPEWSPDGRLIACVVEKQRDKIKEKGILLIDDAGRTIDMLEIDPAPSKLDWSPDGSKIYYARQRKDKPIYDDGFYVFNLSRREHGKVHSFDSDVQITEMSISPLGDKILYKTSEPKIAIYMLDLKNSEIKYLSNGVNSAWYPDGKHITFNTNIDEAGNQINDGYGNIYKMNVETGEKTIVRPVKHLMMLGLRVSKDGKYFYYTIQGAGGGQQIVVSPIDNEKVEIPVTQPIMTSSGFSQDHSPDWYQGD